MAFEDKELTEILGFSELSLSVRVYGDIHSQVSGNKPFKLKHFLIEAKPNQTLVSFGGAWSNHLLALSAVSKKLQRKSVGVIRGEEPKIYSPYLKAMKSNGMHLHFVSRESFREKEATHFLDSIHKTYPNSLIIPEGGAGKKGIRGASDMVSSQEDYDLIFLPGATGTTLAGVAEKLIGSATKVGCIQVLKGDDILRNELLRTAGLDLNSFNHVEVFEQFHFGGYAKKNAELIAFQRNWLDKTNIPLDLVYGSKAMFGLLNLVNTGFFKKGSKILYLHTGGLGPVNQELFD